MQAQLVGIRKFEIVNNKEKYERKGKYYSLITTLSFSLTLSRIKIKRNCYCYTYRTKL